MAQPAGNAAYILRIAPGGIDKIPDALAKNQLIIGWASAHGLLDKGLTWSAFREIVRAAYYPEEPTLHKAGSAAGHLWRFVRAMDIGDLVVVPYVRGGFYVARITGDAVYLPEMEGDDSAYRRSVIWLNDKQPISRKVARAALLSRMKIHGTSADASDLRSEIEACLVVAKSATAPSFHLDLRARLIHEALDEIRRGRINDFGFEELIQDVLLGLGAVECTIVNRSADKGADLVATFIVAGAFRQRVAVQAKHWQPSPPVDVAVVEQLINGIEAEGADLGMVVTSGTIAEAAVQAASRYSEETGIRIELVDGEFLAKLIVENGIRPLTLVNRRTTTNL
jgi:predicted Mrr-cat superfamily restriction endonuclease